MVDATTLSGTGFLDSFLSVIKYNSRVKLSTAVPGERIISLEEVSWHDHSSDCWLVIYDRVYDLTDFLIKHPGGSDILLEYAGRDASVAFRASGHNKQTIQSLSRFLIGELPMNERIFRNPGGYQLSDIPE